MTHGLHSIPLLQEPCKASASQASRRQLSPVRHCGVSHATAKCQHMVHVQCSVAGSHDLAKIPGSKAHLGALASGRLNFAAHPPPSRSPMLTSATGREGSAPARPSFHQLCQCRLGSLGFRAGFCPHFLLERRTTLRLPNASQMRFKNPGPLSLSHHPPRGPPLSVVLSPLCHCHIFTWAWPLSLPETPENLEMDF